MKIVLNGSYGFANFGDDLFNLTSVLGASRFWKGHAVEILGPPVGGVAARFRVPGCFPRALFTTPGFAGKVSRLAFLVAALLRSDLMVYAGGSTLSHGSIMKKVQRVAAERGVTKFAAIGVSIGPFLDQTDEDEAARFLRKFTYFSVRDRKSVELLARMHVPATPTLARDLVGALPLLLPPEAGVARERKGLGISVCGYERNFGGDPEVEDRRNSALFEGIAQFVKRECVPVRIFCLNTLPKSGDGPLSVQLRDRLDRQGAEVELISAQDNLLGVWEGLASCRAVLSVRLHGGITAYLRGVPFSLVEYHRKCTDLLDDIGQPAALRIAGDCKHPDQVDQVLTRLFRNPELPALPREIYSREAVLNFTDVPWATVAG